MTKEQREAEAARIVAAIKAATPGANVTAEVFDYGHKLAVRIERNGKREAKLISLS